MQVRLLAFASAVEALGAPSRDWQLPGELSVRELRQQLAIEFPALAPHPILSKWLYLPENATTFEIDAARLVALIRRLDPRLGVIPGSKAKKPATGKTGGRAPQKRKHFMLE